jgi:hypothetical protein
MEKHGRLGFTESSLMYCYYVRNMKNTDIDINSKEFIKYETSFLNWLFTTSGFYDLSFNYNYTSSLNYEKLMKEFFQMSKQSTFTRFAIHTTSFSKYLPDFYKNFNIIDFSFEKISNEFYDFVRDKNILIINPMSKLMKQQYDSGNAFKINNFPRVNSIQCYTNEYTFFNKGPIHNKSINSFDYIDSIMPDILSIQCDCVIISCGAISSLIANRLDVNKNYLIIGSNLLTLFGIKHDRIKDHPHEYNEYWINVPDEYKPPNYKMIENGCYW